jgi:hypothetical protein
MESIRKSNPWLGLQSYQEGEVLYGRDDDIRDLSQCVINNTETLLYGKSGIGKSSILNAGIIPAARRSGYLPITIRLSHKTEDSYLAQIKQAIENAVLQLYVDEQGNNVELNDADRSAYLTQHIVEKVECSDYAHESIYEYFHRFIFLADDGVTRCKLLIIFDQFEEIFTLQNNENTKRNFFAELADFLNDVKPLALQKENIEEVPDKTEINLSDDKSFDSLLASLDLVSPIQSDDYVMDNDVHMVLTIREDFLSELEYYAASIPSLKQNRYGLRPINDEQAAQIILRPRPGLISKDVAKLIIEKVTGRSDFQIDDIPEIEVDSAVLSLYLNRLYDANQDEIITAKLVEEKGCEIISDFYHDSISHISESSVEYIESALLNGQGRRDNIAVYDAINIGHITEDELNILCNKSKILRQFNYAGDLRIEFVHDILCPVVLAHKEQRQQQCKLDEEKRKREQIEAEAIAARKRNRHRIYGIVAIALFILFTFGAVWAWKYYNNDMLIVKYYTSIDLINGWPVGNTKELTKEQRDIEPIYFKLSKQGASTPNFTDVEICSSNGMLPSRPRIKLFDLGERNYTDSIADKFASDLCKISRLHFSENEDGLIDRTVAFDKDNKSIFLLSYFHIQRNPNGVAWVSFITPSGQSKEVTSSGIDRMKLSWDSIGRESSYMYYDAQYIRAAAEDEHRCQVYGHRFVYADSSVTDIVLDVIGMPLQNTKVNTTITTNHNGFETTEYGNTSNSGYFTPALSFINAWKKVSFGNTNRYYVSLTDTTKFVDQKITRDKYGRPTLLVLNEQSTLHIAGKIKYAYDECNNIIRIDKTQLNSNDPWSGGIDTICHSEWAYDNETLTHEVLKTRNGIVYLYKKTVNGNITTIENENKIANIAYQKTLKTVSGNTTITEFFGKNDLRINIKTNDDTIRVHHIEQIKDGETIITKYFEFNGKNVVPIVYDCDEYSALSYPKKKETFDENGKLTSWIVYDNNDNIRKSMMYKYENGSMIERGAMGIDGNPIRSAEWEKDGYIYYKMHTVLNERNELISECITNEFDEYSAQVDPASKRNTSDRYVKMSFSKYNLPEQFRINNQDVIRAVRRPDYYYTFVDSNYISNQKVAYLHIKSKASALYKLGLKDGDRIICIDNWKYSASMQGFESAWESLYNQGKHVIKVLRPKDNQSFEEIKRYVPQLTKAKYQTERVYCYKLTPDEQQRFNISLTKIKWNDL